MQLSFLDDIFARLELAGETVVLRELGKENQQGSSVASGRGLLRMIAQARDFLASRGLKRGDRCALLAHNSIRWVAMDLAIMAEGLDRGAALCRFGPPVLRRKLAGLRMMKDCSPALIVCGDANAPRRDRGELAGGAAAGAFRRCILWGLRPFAKHGAPGCEAVLADSDPVTIIYTSGTSGEAKGVVLTAGNVGHMLGCTSGRLDALMQNKAGQDRVFHYLPFCFAGSWIMLLTCLLRGSVLALNTDLSKIASDMRTVAPDYFLNVPALLERMRKAVDEQLWKTGGVVLTIYSQAKGAWVRKKEARASFADSIRLAVAKAVVFPTIRKKMIGSHLKALICGSAPLSVETQLYFMMLGIPVLQVYGLTETTAICTMDDPRPCGAGARGPRNRRRKDEVGGERRDCGAWAECFSGLLESSARDCKSVARRMVS